MPSDHLSELPIPSYDESIFDNHQLDNDNVSKAETAISTDTSLSDKPHRPHYDILPSFDMHQSIVNRNIFTYDGDVKSMELPTYGDDDGNSNSRVSNASSNHFLQARREDSIAENLERMSEIHSPIDIKIYIMKETYPECLTKTTNENPTKEFTSRDYINGYYTLKNRSAHSIPFEQITVTFEGCTSVFNPANNKEKSKTFLRYFDLSASYTEARLPISPHTDFIYCCDAKDKDERFMCIPDQELKSGAEYKKFFHFRFPEQLLDQHCDQLFHLMPPPTFGVKEDAKKDIEFNKILGYGRSMTPGSPILMDDKAPKGVAINYSINVRVVGANPNVEDEVKYCLLKGRSHHIRFVPYGFCTPLEYDSTTGEQLDFLYKRLEANLEEAKERAAVVPSKEQDDEDDEDDESIQTTEEAAERKRKQLFIPSFPLPNKYKNDSLQKTSMDLFDTKRNFLSKGSSEKIGVMTVQSSIPADGIPYISPRLVQQSNTKSGLNVTGKRNIDKFDSRISSSEKQTLKNLELEFVFKPLKNSTKPPQLDSIKADLELATLQSVYNIPFSISSDFSPTQEGLSDIRKKFGEISSEFKKLPPRTQINAKTMSDLNAIINLRLTLQTIPFFKITNKEITPWEARQEPDGLTWYRKANLALEINDFQNLTLIPTFQSCLVSRVHYIKVEASFGSGRKATLNVPVRVRKFDWQSGKDT